MTELEGRTIYIAGHAGLVGSALMRRFAGLRSVRLLTIPHGGLDLRYPEAVEAFLRRERPEIVVIAAGRVGGIQANASAPAEFIYDNLMMQTNLIHGAWNAGVRRLLNFGSSCMYPRECPQPMRPEQLMTGRLEPTSEPYALAKLAGWSLCAAYNRQYGTDYITAIPCTLYGPGDNFDLVRGHVLSALVRKFHEAREAGRDRVTLWGSGEARREFLFVDDLAEACELLLRVYEGSEPINVGTGASCSIRELAEAVAEVVGFRGSVEWDRSQPDGAPEKQLDSQRIRALGWQPQTDLRRGLERTYHWFLSRPESRTRTGRAELCRSS